MEAIALLLRERATILKFVIAGMVFGLVIALLRPASYTTTFSFIPQANEDAARGGLASLAGQFGINVGSSLGQGQSPEFYADVLRTREVLAAVAHDSIPTDTRGEEKVSIIEFLGVEGSDSAVRLDNAIRALRDELIESEIASTTGIVTVKVRSRSAPASLGISERLLDELNRFNLVTRQSQAKAEREFVEERLKESRAALRAAEDELQAFLQANRQIANSPSLTFQRERLAREVAHQQQVVTSLAQQYEEARIREVRDVPVITTIERPALAVRPDSRRLIFTVLAGASAAFFLALALVLARHAFRPSGRRGARNEGPAREAEPAAQRETPTRRGGVPAGHG